MPAAASVEASSGSVRRGGLRDRGDEPGVDSQNSPIGLFDARPAERAVHDGGADALMQPAGEIGVGPARVRDEDEIVAGSDGADRCILDRVAPPERPHVQIVLDDDAL